jgi:hypothetical protein
MVSVEATGEKESKRSGDLNRRSRVQEFFGVS